MDVFCRKVQEVAVIAVVGPDGRSLPVRGVEAHFSPAVWTEASGGVADIKLVFVKSCPYKAGETYDLVKIIQEADG
jgi:hypothetical protein